MSTSAKRPKTAHQGNGAGAGDLPDAMDWSAWDEEEGVDEALLLQASQMAEEKTSSSRSAANGAVDPSELAEMTRMLDEDDLGADWNTQAAGTKGATEATTVFLDERGKGSKTTMLPPPPPPRPAVPSSLSKDQELSRLRAELDRALADGKRQRQETQQKNGEVLFLRGELARRDSALDEERRGRRREAEAAGAELQRAEERRRAQVEAAEAEREFLKQDLTQLKQSVMRSPKNNQSMQQRRARDGRKKPAAMPRSTTAPNLDQVPKGIDCSFFEDDRPDDGATISYSQPMEEDDMLDDQASEDMVAEAAAAAPVPRKDASAQTFRRSRRRNADKLKEKLKTLDRSRSNKLLSLGPREESFLSYSSCARGGDGGGTDVAGGLEDAASVGRSLLASLTNKNTDLPKNWDKVCRWLWTCQGIFEEAGEATEDKRTLDASVYLIGVGKDLVEKNCPPSVLRAYFSCAGTAISSLCHRRPEVWNDLKEVLLGILDRQASGGGPSIVSQVLDLLTDLADAEGFVVAMGGKGGDQEASSSLSLRLSSLISDGGDSIVTPSVSSSFVRLLQSLLARCSRGGKEEEASALPLPSSKALLRALVAVSARAMREVLSAPEGEERRKAATSLCRHSVLCLHHLWSCLGQSFASALDESPDAQRKYIWITRQLDKGGRARAALAFHQDEVSILGDLMVEYDDDSPSSLRAGGGDGEEETAK